MLGYVKFFFHGIWKVVSFFVALLLTSGIMGYAVLLIIWREISGGSKG